MKAVRSELFALYLACRDPRTPRHAKITAAVIIGYALSPIDLIPDFVPVLGLLDDAILLPLGLLLVRRMIPPQVMADARTRAAKSPWLKPRNWVVGGFVVLLWMACLIVMAWWAWRWAAG